MAREFVNDRRKSLPTAAGYQQLAGQAAKPDATPLAARELGSKAAKQPTGGVDALRASRTASGGGPTASGGLPWALLGLLAILLAVALGLAFVLWPTSDASVRQPTSVSAQRQSEAAPPSDPLGSSSPLSETEVKEFAESVELAAAGNG